MAETPNVWALARRLTLMKSVNFRINLKTAKNRESCKRWPLHVRFYYRGIKRPTLIVYTPLKNWVNDYYEVGKDLAEYAKKSPFGALYYWTALFTAIFAFFTKPGFEELKRDIRILNSDTAKMTDWGLNSNSSDFINKLNFSIGRDEIGVMNFCLFTLYYKTKYSQHVFNPHSTCTETEMSFISKLKATIEIGIFGVHWMCYWHKSDFDIPTKNMFGEEIKEENPESFFSEFTRRIRQKPRFEMLIIEPRAERLIRGLGLASIETEEML